jgi:hypothetical protein
MYMATTRWFTHSQLWLLVLCAGLASFTGCSDQAANPMASQEQVGTASVRISVGKVTGTGIIRVELVVTASGMDEIREELTFTNEEATGVVVVPAGLGRLFTLNGYGVDGSILYSGSEAADVVADGRIRVSIVMSPASDDGGPLPGLSGTIAGLSFIEVGRASSTNWDSDLEDDGLQISLLFRDVDESLIRWDNAIVRAEVRVYVSTGGFSEIKKYPAPVYRKSDFILMSFSDDPRVEYDALMPNISRDDLRVHSSGTVYVDLILEAEVTLADGSSFADRDWEIATIPPGVLSMYNLE